MGYPLRFGVQTWPEETSWAELRDTWKLVDELGYDTAWVYDHFVPIVGEPTGPCLEGWTALSALAAETSRVRLGVLVTGITYRHPAVLAKMATTVDHVSGGRLILGLGAAWFEPEHVAFGIPFPPAPERIARLDEAAAIIERLWTEPRCSFEGRFYRLVDAVGAPKPVQTPRPPILIGGGGERLLLRVVARRADIWNGFGSPEVFRHKKAVLARHCEDVGRPVEAIEISWAGMVAITSTVSEKRAFVADVASRFGRPPEEIEAGALVGSPEEIRDRIEAYVDAGVTHFIGTYRAPYDRKTIRRFAETILPAFRR